MGYHQNRSVILPKAIWVKDTKRGCQVFFQENETKMSAHTKKLPEHKTPKPSSLKIIYFYSIEVKGIIKIVKIII